MVFLPGLDSETLQEHSKEAPFLNSLARNPEVFSLMKSSFKEMEPTTYMDKVINNPKQVFRQLQDPQAKYSLEDYLLTEQQLLENGFPCELEEGFVESEETKASALVGIDCEMVRTQKGLELARLSIVSETGEVIYDAFVKPENEVVDYLTPYSGITSELLSKATVNLTQVQTEVKKLISKSTIVCGHSLENDMKVLKLVHKKIIDSSVLYPHPVPTFKFGLKKLAERYLQKSIQNVMIKSGIPRQHPRRHNRPRTYQTQTSKRP